MTTIDIDAIRALHADWRTGVTACPQSGNPCNTCHQRAEDVAEVAPDLLDEIQRLREQLYAATPVAEAARKWVDACEDGDADMRSVEDALYYATEQMRLMVDALDAAYREHAEAVAQ